MASGGSDGLLPLPARAGRSDVKRAGPKARPPFEQGWKENYSASFGAASKRAATTDQSIALKNASM